MSSPLPLCVDLDGTLLRSDLLYESLFALLRRNPFYLLLLPLWLLRGKAHLKRQIARRVRLDPALLPWHTPLLERLQQERAAGRRLILATASDQLLVTPIATHLALFDEVIASDGERNLSGAEKGRLLVERFGERGFIYAGNAPVDLAVWSHAASAWVVSPSPALQRAAARVAPAVEPLAPASGHWLLPLLRALRPHQWLKNLLLLVPLLASHSFSGEALGYALLAIVAFSLCASSVYLLNDLLDLEADRQHPTKVNRPFASGALPLQAGLLAAPLLLLVALLVALLLPLSFLAILASYYLLTLAYSFYLKRVELIDVLLLATLYTVRILAGAAAIAVTVSFWLLALSMFLFLSLALVKRYSELLTLRSRGEESAAGRGYRAVDLESLAQMGAASGYLAVLVLALYINSEEIRLLYQHPAVVWLLCPLLLYLISRVWLLARRDELHEDPLVFVARDRHSLAVAALGGVLFWLAI